MNSKQRSMCEGNIQKFGNKISIPLLLIKITQNKITVPQIVMHKSSKKISLSPDIASFEPSKSPQLSPTSMSKSAVLASISAFSEKYKKVVESIIKIQESLYDSKMPQKCLPHNINYTLYCETDHKVLCTRCMYQNNMHKLHTVKPLNQCVELLGKDCSKLEKQMERVLEKLQEYMDYSLAQTTRIERQYPPAKDKIQDLYKYLHQFLFDQEKQNIKTLRAYKAILMEQQRILTKQVLRVKTYVEQKINKYKGKFGEDELLTKKNVCLALLNTQKIIIDELKIDLKNKEEKYKYGEGLKQTMKEFFEESLHKMYPWGNCKSIMKDIKTSRKQKQKSKQKNDSKEKNKLKKTFEKKTKVQSPQANKSSPQKSSPEKINQQKKQPQLKIERTPSKKLISRPSPKSLIFSKSKQKKERSANCQSRKQLMMKNSLLVDSQQKNTQSKRDTNKSEGKSKEKGNNNLNKLKVENNSKIQLKNQKSTVNKSVSKQKQVIKLKK